MNTEALAEDLALRLEMIEEDSPLGGFSNRLDENLTKRDVPLQFGFTALLPVLVELFVGLLGDCFGAEDDDEETAEQFRSPKTIHRIGLRRKIRIEMFDRSGRKFREGNGNEMVSALLATGKESTQDEALVVVKYVRKNEVPTDNSSWVV